MSLYRALAGRVSLPQPPPTVLSVRCVVWTPLLFARYILNLEKFGSFTGIFLWWKATWSRSIRPLERRNVRVLARVVSVGTPRVAILVFIRTLMSLFVCLISWLRSLVFLGVSVVRLSARTA